MTWSLRLLGLPDDADERAIKRAYASKLKTTRPDEDPEGFQRLHEAYQAALAWVRSGPHDDDDDDGEWHDAPDVHDEDENDEAGEDDGERVVDEAARSPTPVPAIAVTDPSTSADRARAPMDAARQDEVAAPAAQVSAERDEDNTRASVAHDADDTVVFDHDGFFDTCFQIACDGAEGELRQWLDAQPILWSLAYKAQIGHWLLHAMHQRQPPMPTSRFDLLMDYFGLIDLRNGYDAYYLQRLRHRLQIAWELKTSQLRALAERTADEGTSVAAAVRQVRRILRDLSRPFDWTRALLSALMPMYPTAVRRFLYRLDYDGLGDGRLEHGDLDDLPAPLDPAQVAFWDAASDRSRLTRQRFAVVVSRLLAYTALLTLAYVCVVGAFSRSDTPEGAAPWASIPLPSVAAYALFAMSGAWLLWTGHTLFSAWQAREDDPDEDRPMLRRFAIPALLAVALAIAWVAPDGWIGTTGGVLLMAATLAAWSRHRERSGPPLGPHLGYWRVFVLFVIVRAIGEHQGWMNDARLLGAVAGLALFVWAKDLWRQRRT